MAMSTVYDYILNKYEVTYKSLKIAIQNLVRICSGPEKLFAI